MLLEPGTSLLGVIPMSIDNTSKGIGGRPRSNTTISCRQHHSWTPQSGKQQQHPTRNVRKRSMRRSGVMRGAFVARSSLLSHQRDQRVGLTLEPWEGQRGKMGGGGRGCGSWGWGWGCQPCSTYLGNNRHDQRYSTGAVQ